MGVLFITHNLGVVAEIATQVTVMYAGEVVESGDVKTVFRNPRHPYTRALMACLPARARRGPNGRRLVNFISGTVASVAQVPDGCKFSPRCADAAKWVRKCWSWWYGTTLTKPRLVRRYSSNLLRSSRAVDRVCRANLIRRRRDPIAFINIMPLRRPTKSGVLDHHYCESDSEMRHQSDVKISTRLNPTARTG